MNPLLILVLIVWAVSGVGLIVFVLLHSGKGTGVSDMIASSLYSTQTGTNIIEKNLDRITIIFAIVFMLSLLALMLLYPQGTISRYVSKFLQIGSCSIRRVPYNTNSLLATRKEPRRSGGTADTLA